MINNGLCLLALNELFKIFFQLTFFITSMHGHVVYKFNLSVSFEAVRGIL